jgi:SAM-dependent MidA family methyltransferase
LGDQLLQATGYQDMEVGSRVEISVPVWSKAETIAQAIHQHGGAAVIIDYGNDAPASHSLRASNLSCPVQLPANE